MDPKSDAQNWRAGKTEARCWAETVFHRKRGGVEDTDWTAQIQFRKRQEQFPLGAPNKSAAAAKARDSYLSFQARGWEATLIQYKAKAGEPKNETPPSANYRAQREFNALAKWLADHGVQGTPTFSVVSVGLRRKIRRSTDTARRLTRDNLRAIHHPPHSHP